MQLIGGLEAAEERHDTHTWELVIPVITAREKEKAQR
jgi:hypothetical protein